MTRCGLLVVVFFILQGMAGCERGAGNARNASSIDLRRLFGRINIDGSPAEFPLSQAVAEAFMTATGGTVLVTMEGSGSPGPFSRFVRGQTDILCASRPILDTEMNDAKESAVEYFELLVGFDAVAVVVNNENNWVDHLSVEELKTIWEPAAPGCLTRWSRVRDGWPNQPLEVFYSDGESAAFINLADVTEGMANSSRNDTTRKHDNDIVVQGIENNRYAIGFLPMPCYASRAARIKAIPIERRKNNDRGVVFPDRESVLKGYYNLLSRPLFIYVNKKASEEREVKAFVEFYLKHAATFATEVNCVALPSAAYDEELKRFNDRWVGTTFGGAEVVDINVEELLRRKPAS